MNRLLTLPVLLLTLLVGNPAFSADFQKGLDAYDRGDYTTALGEWTPLAEQGNTYAPGNLGVMYAKGQGVIEDHVFAHMWLNIAVLSGNTKASKNRDVVAGWMTPADLSAAKKLARECVRK